jgi:hypothetical protein
MCITRTRKGQTCSRGTKSEGINDRVHHLLSKGELGLKELRKGCLLLTLEFLRTLKVSRSKYKKTHQSALFNEAKRGLEDVLFASRYVLESIVTGIDAYALEKTVATIA